MIAEFKSHKLGYVLLITILFLFVLAFLHFWPDREKQRYVALAMSIFYFFWGVITHKKIGRINKKVVFEYLAVSILSSSILIMLTF